ncbi:MAG: helix-turn-helix domain-containing protein [Pseudomonadota bacterium]
MRAIILDGRLGPSEIAAIHAALDDPEQQVVWRLPSVAEIIARVSTQTGVRTSVMIGEGRGLGALRARYAVAWMGYCVAGHTLERIGRALGGRDHSTIRHAVAQAKLLRRRDPAFLMLTDGLVEYFAPTGECAA